MKMLETQITFACKKATLSVGLRKRFQELGTLRIGAQDHPYRPGAIHQIFFIPMKVTALNAGDQPSIFLETELSPHTILASCPLSPSCPNCSGDVVAQPVPGTDYYMSV